MKKFIIGTISTLILMLFGISAYASTSDALDAYAAINYAQSVSGAEYELDQCQ